MALSLIALILIACFRLRLRLPREALYMLILPFAMIILGMIGAPGHDPRDILKDVWYFSFGPLTVFAGYLLGRSSRPFEFSLFVFICAGIMLSLYQIGDFTAHRGLLQTEDLNGLRDKIGGGYMLCILSPLILFLSSHFGIKLPFLYSRRLRYGVYGVTFMGIATSFSRTLLLALVLAVVVGLGWLTKKRRRGIVAVAAVVLIFSGLSYIVPESQSSFLGKIARTQDELTFSDFRTEGDVIRYWRSYETLVAFETYARNNNFRRAIGMGFGQLVDIGMEVQLGNDFMRYIPILHNGYMYILVKTGYLGLFAFFLFMGKLYSIGARHADSSCSSCQLIGGLVMSTVAIVVVSTFVISGWFNPVAMYPVVLLLGSALGMLAQRSAGRTCKSVEGFGVMES